jgi:very-short-patch-repair endonuclease
VPVAPAASVPVAAAATVKKPTVSNLAKLEAELRDVIGDSDNEEDDDKKDAKDDEDMENEDKKDDNNNDDKATLFNSGHKPPKQAVPDDDAHAALRAKCKAKIERYAELRAHRPKAPYTTEITDDELLMYRYKQYVDDQTLALNVRCISAGSGYYATFRCEEKCEHGKVHGEWTRQIKHKSGYPKCSTQFPKTGVTASYAICCVRASIASLPTDSRIRREWHPTKNAEIGIFQETTGISSNKKVYLCHPHGDDMRDDHSANCNGHLSFVVVNNITGSDARGCGFTGCCKIPQYIFCEAQSLLGKFLELCKAEYIETSIKASEVFTSSNKKVWWKCRHCANVWKTNTYDRTYNGSGCPHCASSQRETLMFSILQQIQADFLVLNMTITRQQKMGTQRGDFGVEIKIAGVKKIANIIVETDGGQHFESIDMFGGAAQFKVQQALDARKNKFCVDHGLTLFRIGNYVNKNHYHFVALSLILLAIRTAGEPITRFVVHGKNARHQYTKQLAALPNDADDALVEF